MCPVIGIASCGFAQNGQFVSQPYIHAIETSNGFPVILPCTDSLPPLSSLHIFDGFLFCGGGDITPILLGEDPSPENGSTDLTADLFHLGLMRAALDLGKPVLAICRGMQILNVAMGGSIYQDASLYPRVSIGHMQQSRCRSDASHKVFFQKPSMLYNIFGEYALTNSYHHQYIKHPAAALTPTGRTSDQVIEALESSRHPFALGVQWHPECMYDSSAEMRLLFSAFIHAASATSGNQQPAHLHHE